MKVWKKRGAINSIALLIYGVKQRWAKKKLAVVLFMNVKEIFNYISKF